MGRFDGGARFSPGRFSRRRGNASPPDPEAIEAYLSDFRTDRTADLSGTVAWDQTITYSTVKPAFDNYLEALGAGAVYFGHGGTSIVDQYIAVDVEAGLEYEIYTLADCPTVAGGVTYGGSTNLTRLFFDWYAGATLLSTETAVANVAEPVLLTRTAPATATSLRVRYQKRGTGTRPVAIYYLSVFNFPEGVSRPASTGVSPVAHGLFVPTGGSADLDFAASFPDATSIEVSGAGATASGRIATVAPSTDLTAELLETRGVRGSLKSIVTDPVYVTSAGAGGGTPRTGWTVRLEAGDGVTLDPIIMLQDTASDWWGVEPYTCEVLSKPTWMITGKNGHHWGYMPAGSAGADTSLSVRVTDGLGSQATITWPIERVAWDRSSPQTIAPTTDLRTAITVNGSGPTVVQLQAGDYQLGNFFGWAFANDKPLIIIGASVGISRIVGANSTAKATNWRFENVMFEFTSLPLGVQADVAAERRVSLASQSQEVIKAETSRVADTYTGHCFFRGCTFHGFEQPDLTLEAAEDMLVREVSTGVFENQDPPNQTGSLPVAGTRHGVMMYGSGLEMMGLIIAQECHATRCVFPYILSGPMNGLFDVTSNLTATDTLRLFGYNDGNVVHNYQAGSYDAVKDGRFAFWGNYRPDGHCDAIQLGAPNIAGSRHGGRVLVSGMFVRANGHPEMQGWQNNSYSVGPADPEDDPRRGAFDWHTLGNFIGMGPMANGTHFETSGEGYLFEQNTIIPDPTNSDYSQPITTSIMRLTGRTNGIVKDSIGWRQVFGSPKPWTLDNLTLFDGNYAGLQIAFPNIANTGLTYDDPREAVEAGGDPDDARFWADPASIYASSFPDWMKTGVRAGPSDGVTGVIATAAPPTVSTLSPADGASGAATDASLVMTFSKAMTQQGTVVLKNVGGASIETFDLSTDGAWSVGNTVWTGTPASALTHDADLAGRWSGLEDDAGTALADNDTDTEWNFGVVAASVVPLSFTAGDTAFSITLGWSINLPTNVAGDLLVVATVVTGSTTTPAAPAGWTRVMQTDVALFYKVSSGSEASVPFTNGSTKKTTRFAFKISGYFDIATVETAFTNVYNQSGTETAVSVPVVTAAAGGTWVTMMGNVDGYGPASESSQPLAVSNNYLAVMARDMATGALSTSAETISIPTSANWIGLLSIAVDPL